MNDPIPAVTEQVDTLSPQPGSATFGIWVFIATELMFFGPLFVGYLYGRTHFGHAFVAASNRTHLWLGTLNTAILLTSSLSIALAVRAAQLDDRKALSPLLRATAILGALFLGLKGSEYYQEWQEALVPALHFSFDGEYTAGARYFFYLYYLMTGLHALHLAIGIGLVAWLLWRTRRQQGHCTDSTAVAVVALYWHFVDIVWIFLYPLIYLLERYR